MKFFRFLGTLSVSLWACSAFASPPDLDATPEGAQPTAAATQVDFMGSIGKREALLGQMGGLRPWLSDYGVTLSLIETSEYLGNVTGGTRKGGAYDGLTTATIQLDTEKAFGWEGGLFNVSGLDIHGKNLSRKNLSDLQTASGIEADNTARLWELWYQQSFLNGDMDVKIGQQSVDQEFMVSSNSLLFVNTMNGWPMLPSADLPSGGPAYPLSSPGIRLRGTPTDSLLLLAGVFNDNPSGIQPGSSLDSQKLNDRGTNFRLSDDPIVITEIQYSRPGNSDMQYAGQSDVLPGTYRFGAWYDFGRFQDQEFGTDGLSLADPASNGTNRIHCGNYILYVVIDQMIWRPNPESGRGLNFFARAMGAPPDRNQIDFSINTGFTYKGILASRVDDTLGIVYGLANISSNASNLDQQRQRFRIRTKEHFIEVTYQMQVLPWIQVQPDFQYVINPGAGIANPHDATSRVGDEMILGVRTNITF